jgi:hypothetical protein
MTNQVQPITKVFNTARDQAEYFFNREFNSIAHFDMLKCENGILEIMNPSDKIITKEFFNNGYSDLATELESYNELNDMELTEDNYLDDSDFIQVITENSEFENYRYGDFESNNYPMWNTVWRCEGFYIESDYCNVDKLYDLGIGVIDHESGYYLFISGAGYSFYQAHWIPLFKMLGWIKESE